MSLYDLHTHTTYSDGENTPEEMVQRAIEMGLTKIGFSDHSYTSFEDYYCLTPQSTEEYKAEINALKEKYKGKIEILCGIEQDCYTDLEPKGFDYIIGSVHFVKIDDKYIAVDDTEEILVDAANKYFGGDIYSLIELYYETASDVVETTNADIIGHLDLITKFNEGGKMFDESHPRYVKAYKSAVDKLIKYGKPFEINSGAMSRGYRTSPYPSKEIIDYIKSLGGTLIYSSDSHSADTLCYGIKDKN